MYTYRVVYQNCQPEEIAASKIVITDPTWIIFMDGHAVPIAMIRTTDVKRVDRLQNAAQAAA